VFVRSVQSLTMVLELPLPLVFLTYVDLI